MRSVANVGIASTASIASAMAVGIACMSWPELLPEKDLVPPSQLESTLLPVAGWTMGEVTSDKVSGELPLTHAQTAYSSDGTVLKVEITDSGMIARAYANLMWGYEEDTGGSRSKSTEVGSTPAVENWYASGKEGTLSLLVANRFIVTITGKGIDDIGVLHDFASKLDTTKLAALGKYRAT